MKAQSEATVLALANAIQLAVYIVDGSSNEQNGNTVNGEVLVGSSTATLVASRMNKLMAEGRARMDPTI